MLPAGERLLLSRRSPYHALYLTEDEHGQRTLRFGEDGVRQSVMYPHEPGYLVLDYARLVPATLALAPPIQRMLCMGLGGGSLPRFFHHTVPVLQVDVVEIDVGVVQVACEHFGLQEDARLHVHVADGRDFIEAHAAPWDFILLDAYDADLDAVPQHLTTLEFFAAARAALTRHGLVVANVWGRETNPRYDDMLHTFQAAFAATYVFDVPRPQTKLFVGLASPLAITREEVLHWTRQAAAAWKLPYDLSAMVAGFRPAQQERTRGGRLLRDADA